MRTFKNTHAALVEHDRTAPERDKVCDDIETVADLTEWQAAELDALRKVQDAFHADTYEFNLLESCRLLTVHEIRRITRFKKSLDNL